MPRIATADVVSREQLLEFLRTRHRALLLTRRRDGSAQLSPVSAGLDADGRVVVATYPQRAKVRNARRNGQVSLCLLSDDWDGAWVQVDGTVEVLDLPEALEPFVEYYRSIAGEHPDWEDYRAAMVRQGTSLLGVTIERWGRWPPAASRPRRCPGDQRSPDATGTPRTSARSPAASSRSAGRTVRPCRT